MGRRTGFVKALLLKPVRRGREIAWTPDFMRFGNHLLLLLWAYDRRRSGADTYVLVSPALRPWLEVFPALDALVVRHDQVRFSDQRLSPWSEAARARGAEHSVPLHEQINIGMVEDFVADHLLPGSILPGAGKERESGAHGRLVVNVRRGDYYSDEGTRNRYGFDVQSYLRVAVEGSVRDNGQVHEIHVVSDGLDWCREHLAWLSDVTPTVTFAPPDHTPVSDFLTVATSRRIVMTNSTFSYWAAHVSNVLHGNNHPDVWAPVFFDRDQNRGRSWLLDPRWSIVTEIPSGWDL